VRFQKLVDPSTTWTNIWSAHERVAVKRRRPDGEAATTRSTGRSELVVRDADGRLVYRLTLPCDPIEDANYLVALLAASRSRPSRASGRGARRCSTPGRSTS
jgi:hypothetical protein